MVSHTQSSGSGLILCSHSVWFWYGPVWIGTVHFGTVPDTRSYVCMGARFKPELVTFDPQHLACIYSFIRNVVEPEKAAGTCCHTIEPGFRKAANFYYEQTFASCYRHSKAFAGSQTQVNSKKATIMHGYFHARSSVITNYHQFQCSSEWQLPCGAWLHLLNIALLRIFLVWQDLLFVRLYTRHAQPLLRV